MKLLSNETMYQAHDWLDPEDTVNPLREQWNKEAFEEMQGELADAQDKIESAQKDASRYEEDCKEIRETLRGLLTWLTECEEKYFEKEGKTADEYAAKFFAELLTEVKDVAKDTGFWNRGRLDLCKDM